MPATTASASRSAGSTGRCCSARRDAYIERLNGLYAANLAKRNVELMRARATFLDAHNVSAGGRTLAAAHIVVASGGRPLRAADPGRRARHHLRRLLRARRAPGRVAVVGSSYIGVELAGIFAGLGSHTTLVLRGETALRSLRPDARGGDPADPARGGRADRQTQRRARRADAPRTAHSSSRRATAGASARSTACSGRSVASRRSEDLALERAGVQLDGQGFIATDLYQATSAAGHLRHR